ncbi:MAG TPA: hypothetical protein VFF73_22600 [Planctomycetota bacterium]|nr:hypothetical protein [Planctomycetota bacterium]
MHCHAHAGIRPSARCTSCGVLLCVLCREFHGGRVLCSNCARGGGEVVRAIKVVAHPIPPAMPVTLPQQVKVPSPSPSPPAARRSRPAVAGILGIVPGLGHLYARRLRGFVYMGAGAAAIVFTALGWIPLAIYGLFHGLVAFDGWRLARIRNGEWSREDARQARGIAFATAGSAVLLSAAHAAGTPFSAGLALAGVLIPLGVGIALGARSNRVNAKCELTPAQPRPGVDIDRRADRAELAAQLQA